MWYDCHVHTKQGIGEDTAETMAAMAKRLGMTGIGLVTYYPDLPDHVGYEGIDVVRAVMIKATHAQELTKAAQRCRSAVDLVLVHGGDYDVNRAACENPLVDILCHPELGRHDSGIDHICAKAAADNNVAVEINFREILELNKKQRAYALSSMRRNVALCRQFRAPLITASGAVNKWGMRAGRELAAIAHMLGLDLRAAIDTVSVVPGRMITANRAKLAGTTIEGMEIEDEEGQA